MVTDQVLLRKDIGLLESLPFMAGKKCAFFCFKDGRSLDPIDSIFDISG